MNKIFICGGAGFVGYHIVRRLLELPPAERIEHIEIFDNLSSGKMDNLFGLPADRVNVTIGNARDYDMLRCAMFGADTVFHLAANPDIAKAATEPTIDFERGTVLTRNVVEAARVNGVERIVFFSGSGVYGDRGERLLTEDMAGNPVSPYGAAKLASEAMLSAYSSMFGIKALVFRMGNIVGSHQTHGVGYDFLRKLKADPTRLEILGDGRQSKSYIGVDDVLNAVVGAIHQQEAGKIAPYDVFNVATDDWMTVTHIAMMAEEIMTSSSLKGDYNYSGGRVGWNGDVPIVRLDSSKIKSRGWRALKGSSMAMYDALVAMKDEL